MTEINWTPKVGELWYMSNDDDARPYRVLGVNANSVKMSLVDMWYSKAHFLQTWHRYDADTAEILDDPEAMRMLAESEEDVKAGLVVDGKDLH